MKIQFRSLIIFSFVIIPFFAMPAIAEKVVTDKITTAAATSKTVSEVSKTKKSKKSKKSKSKKSFNFDALIKKAEDNKTGSLVILQDGKFLVENNWESPLAFYYLQGMTPGILTMALGALINEDKFTLQSPVMQWIPEWNDKRSGVQIQNLLHQTSGCTDDPKDLWYKAPDTTSWVKTQSPQKESGEFQMAEINSLALGVVIAKVTDADPEILIKNKIMDPLKIQKWSIDKDPLGHSNTASGLRLRNYDLLKIGNLWAQKGAWNDQKIISPAWMEQIQKPSEKNPEFGMNFWLKKEKDLKALYLVGNQGQYLVIIPEKKIVALRLRPLVPIEQNKVEQDWQDFPKEILQMARQL